MRTHSPYLTSLGALFLALLMLAPRPLAAQQDPYQVRTFRAGETPVVRVHTPTGDIEVIGEEGREEVRIEMYVNRGISVWTRSGNLDNYRITTAQRGREILASVEPKGSFGGDHVRFSYRVLTPPGVALRLQTSNGDIDVEGVTGERQDLSTSSGDITVRSSSGVIRGNTNRGDISLENFRGEIRLRILGGAIDAERITGDMVAEITRGDIRAQFDRVNLGMRLETTRGDIAVRLPVQPFEFDLRGSEVRFSTSGSFEGIRRSDLVEGSLREGGGPRIILRSTSGTVSVETE
ncbi:MAG: DUF4097 family beta strand repeat-containing protein [Balneolaceae bacterium]|nr:DUF4097 family beta strand repeat-containing protein [Balneolaceae bacterium]